MSPFEDQEPKVETRLKEAGLRPTRQRIQLGCVVWARGHRHLSAEALHAEARREGVTVSLATVYNTLHQFTEAGLLREIVVEGGRSYFDTNMDEHHHFFCESTGMLADIPACEVDVVGLPCLPAGKSLSRVDVIIRVRDN